MENPIGPNGFKNILPALDLGILLILILFGIAGFGELNAKVTPSEAELSRSNVTMDEMERELLGLRKRNKSLRRRIKEKAVEAMLEEGQQRRPVKHATASRSAAVSESIRRLKAEIGNQNQLLEKYRLEINALEKEKALLEARRTDLRDHSKKLLEIEERNRRLAEDVARIRKEELKRSNPVIQVDSTPLIRATTKRKPVYILLINGTVTPVCVPYFTQKQEVTDLGGGRFEARIVYALKRKGETIDQALSEGSAFTRLLRDISPEYAYAALLVDASSFETFRAVREALRQRGIRFGWEPCMSKTIRISATGQLVGEEVDG